ncbi:hypothetical protein [Streptacidiphilus cavernicola]|uniref:Uncharacterized protein n=1 Tax=Streptacidiphilus cavernicola TaxID=3342716 RepID=A0ABV6W482_9ACTN
MTHLPHLIAAALTAWSRRRPPAPLPYPPPTGLLREQWHHRPPNNPR